MSNLLESPISPMEAEPSSTQDSLRRALPSEKAPIFQSFHSSGPEWEEALRKASLRIAARTFTAITPVLLGLQALLHTPPLPQALLNIAQTAIYGVAIAGGVGASLFALAELSHKAHAERVLRFLLLFRPVREELLRALE